MITNENIKKFKSYGFVLTPVNKTNDFIKKVIFMTLTLTIKVSMHINL